LASDSTNAQLIVNCFIPHPCAMKYIDFGYQNSSMVQVFFGQVCWALRRFVIF